MSRFTRTNILWNAFACVRTIHLSAAYREGCFPTLGMFPSPLLLPPPTLSISQDHSSSTFQMSPLCKWLWILTQAIELLASFVRGPCVSNCKHGGEEKPSVIEAHKQFLKRKGDLKDFTRRAWSLSFWKALQKAFQRAPQLSHNYSFKIADNKGHRHARRARAFQNSSVCHIWLCRLTLGKVYLQQRSYLEHNPKHYVGWRKSLVPAQEYHSCQPEAYLCQLGSWLSRQAPNL